MGKLVSTEKTTRDCVIKLHKYWNIKGHHGRKRGGPLLLSRYFRSMRWHMGQLGTEEVADEPAEKEDQNRP
jgi:hypothetical protein